MPPKRKQTQAASKKQAGTVSPASRVNRRKSVENPQPATKTKAAKTPRGVKSSENSAIKNARGGSSSTSSSGSTSSPVMTKAKQPSKSKPKSALLPTRPPSARRREKLERQLALLHGLPIPAADDTDEIDHEDGAEQTVHSEDDMSLADENSFREDEVQSDERQNENDQVSNVNFEMPDETVDEVKASDEEMPISGDSMEIVEESIVAETLIADLDSNPASNCAEESLEELPASVIEEVVTEEIVEVAMEASPIKDVETETCEIAKQLAALEVDKSVQNETENDAPDENKETANGTISDQHENECSSSVENTAAVESYQEVTSSLIQLEAEDNNQVVIEEVVVSVEESFEMEETNTCNDMQNVEEIIGLGHNNVRYTLTKPTIDTTQDIGRVSTSSVTIESNLAETDKEIIAEEDVVESDYSKNNVEIENAQSQRKIILGNANDVVQDYEDLKEDYQSLQEEELIIEDNEVVQDDYDMLHDDEALQEESDTHEEDETFHEENIEDGAVTSQDGSLQAGMDFSGKTVKVRKKGVRQKVKTSKMHDKREDKAKIVKKDLLKKIKQEKKMSEEGIIRRSTRIKSISLVKKTPTGRGLVKPKNDSEHSENSNLSGNDEKSAPTESPKSVASEVEAKPPRKSRWQKIIEPDMNASSENTPTLLPSQVQSAPSAADKVKNDQEIESRLKQFVHLKENLYKTDRMTCKEAKKMVCDCFLTEEDIARGEYACGEDCLNRLLLIECGALCPVNERCTNNRFQKGTFAPVEVFRTEKKGLGLRAAANIPYGDFILEYVGEVLDSEEFERRAEHYSKDKNLHYYFMSLRADAVIDATIKGNISRFINHSCEPNAETQKWTVNGELRIGFFSTRTILAGEEITFDYRFQRYGKEAQKCYCEAPSCRGWLGEEPDEDEDEEDEEEEEEEGDEEEESEVILDVVEETKPPAAAEPVTTRIETAEVPEKSIDVTTDEQAQVNVSSSEVTVTGIKEIVKEVSETLTKTPPKAAASVKKEKKEKKIRAAKKKPRKDLFDDFDQLDTEIELLLTTGLKNQAHTLKLSRLIVRAKEPPLRTKLLRILRRGELPCRRLFLDYNGLRFIHGYMIDAQQLAIKDKKFVPLKLELLQTLATLPIPNKTMLQDSKVLPTVEKWSRPEKGDASPTDSDTNSPNTHDTAPAPTEEAEPVQIKAEPQPQQPQPPAVVEEPKQQEPEAEEFEIRKSVGMDGSPFQAKTATFQSTSGKSLADEISESFDEDTAMEDVKPTVQPVEPVEPETNYEEEIMALALKLLEEWANLKESFRIPKRERIEQMKLHEREANKGFYAGLGAGAENEERRPDSRYRNQRWRSDKTESPVSRKGATGAKLDERAQLQQLQAMNKHQRRKLFALQVEVKEEERRRKQQEMWQQHEKQCMMLGTDPRFTAPFDPSRGYQCIWNPQIGQWQNYPLPPQPAPHQTPVIYNAIASLPNTSVPPPQLAAPQLSQMPTNIPPPQLQQGMMGAGLRPPLPPPNTMQPPLPAGLAPPPQQMAAGLPGYQYPAHPLQSMPMAAVQPYQQMPAVQGIQQIPLPTMQQMGLPQVTPMQVQNMQMALQNIQMPLHAAQQIQPPLPPLPATPKPQEKMKDEEKEDMPVRFAGPIPPPVKLPPKWKCAKDKYGRPYYYHIKIRVSQWEPPPFLEPPEEPEESSESSSTESSSGSSDSSSDDSDSEEDMDDTKLLIEVRKQMELQAKLSFKNQPVLEENDSSSPVEEAKSNVDEEEPEAAVARGGEDEGESSIDRRLKEQFNLLTDCEPPPAKRSRNALVQEFIISPRSEADRLQSKTAAKQYKKNKEDVKRQKEALLIQARKQAKEQAAKEKLAKERMSKAIIKSKLKEMTHDNSEKGKRIKETFRTSMANVVVGVLNAYRKPDCKEGRINNTEDFKHLARKLTHFVMLKEMKHISKIEELTCTDNVKSKAREYIRKYMAKFGETYQKREDEPDF